MNNLALTNLLKGLNVSNDTNPFVGLRSYDFDEGHLFFGRDDQIKDLLSKLQSHHFLAVVGRSGCGKSSLIKAGLIPKLKGGFLANDRDHWLTASMRPAGNPLENFLNALADTYSPEFKPNINFLYDELKEMGPSGFVEKIKDEFKNSRFNLLILIDQFEELFTYDIASEAHKNDNAYFVNLLLALAKDPALPIFTVITMRSDYIGHCNRFFELPELMNNAQYLVPRLKWQQIKEVIEFPIKLYDREINQGLLDQLTNDSDKELDQLPVLQHCMMRTYKNAIITKKTIVNFDHYEETGGLNNAIQKHADEIYESLSPTQQETAKYLFQIITEFNSDLEGIRRPRKFKEIAEICLEIQDLTKDDLLTVLEKFMAKDCAFLISSTKKIKDHTTIDISHESLLRQWDRLKVWMTEEQDSSRKFKWLSDNVTNNREFLTGIDLRDAELWKEKKNHTPLWASRYADNYSSVIKYIMSSIVRRNKIKKNKLILRYFLAFIILSSIILLGLYSKSKLEEEQNNIAAGKVKLQKEESTIAALQEQTALRELGKTLQSNMDRFEVLKLGNRSLIDSSFNKMMKNHKEFSATYNRLINLDTFDTLERVYFINEFQGVNFQIIDLLNRKVNLNKNWDENSFIYNTAVQLCKQNVELGIKKYHLKSNLPNKVDLSTRYGALAYKQLFSKDFKGAIASSEKGLNIYIQNDWINTDLAAATLLDGQYNRADSIYNKYMEKDFLNKQNNFKDAFRDDFNALELKGIISKRNKILYQKVTELRKLL